MRLYITAVYAWQTARNDTELTTRPFAFVPRPRLPASPRSFCLTCITAAELPAGVGGGAGERGARARGERGEARSRPQPEDDEEQSGSQSQFLSDRLPPTAARRPSQPAGGGEGGQKEKPARGAEGARERWRARASTCPVGGSPS